MRIKILVIGGNPVSIVSDCQLLRDRGLMVFTTFNIENINELAAEIKPDIIFFDVCKPTAATTEAYNKLLSNEAAIHIPVIYTLSEDDVYLVTRKRTAVKEKRNIIASTIIDAIKMALRSNKTYHKKTYTIPGNTQLSFFPARA